MNTYIYNTIGIIITALGFILFARDLLVKQRKYSFLLASILIIIGWIISFSSFVLIESDLTYLK